MIIVENSNIVNWSEYPEYICALVMQTTEDIKTTNGLVCPKGEELIWLLDKSPSINGDYMALNDCRVNFLGGLGILSKNVIFPANPKEIHYKPKPSFELEKSRCFSEWA